MTCGRYSLYESCAVATAELVLFAESASAFAGQWLTPFSKFARHHLRSNVYRIFLLRELLLRQITDIFDLQFIFACTCKRLFFPI